MLGLTHPPDLHLCDNSLKPPSPFMSPANIRACLLRVCWPEVQKSAPGSQPRSVDGFLSNHRIETGPAADMNTEKRSCRHAIAESSATRK